MPETVGDDERLGARRPAPRVVEVDDRDDVDRADVRVQPVMGGEVDARDRRTGAGNQRVREGPGRPREREDRAVVVGVGVGLGGQQPDARGPAERRPDSCEDRRVAAVGDVGDGEECGG